MITDDFKALNMYLPTMISQTDRTSRSAFAAEKSVVMGFIGHHECIIDDIIYI